jgi:hypothetical protein
MTLRDILDGMTPDDKKAIVGLLTVLGFDPNSSLDEVTRPMIDAPKTQEEGLALLSFIHAKSNNGKFAAKLSFQQRCEILALHRKGCTRELLARAYNVDRRTITHIYNPASTHYKNVREEEMSLGRNHFIEKYVTNSVWQHALSLVKDEVHVDTNNPKADRKAGIHNMQNDYCDRAHRVIIGWVNANPEENVQVSGWYYKDLDSEWPDDWFNCGPESLKTSQAAFNAAQQDISD